MGTGLTGFYPHPSPMKTNSRNFDEFVVETVVNLIEFGDLPPWNKEWTSDTKWNKEWTSDTNKYCVDSFGDSYWLDNAERVLGDWCVKTQFGGKRAMYYPDLDIIKMPYSSNFRTREEFYATWAHEQAHSTGHKSRLNRPLGGIIMGLKSHAREELIAELAAVLVCYRLQIGCDIKNHAAYLKNWANVLEKGSEVLFEILSQAKDAADLITQGVV